MSDSRKYYLAACSVFRDEATNLREWIEFHRLVGIEHFFLYNNLSTDTYASVLEPYLRAGVVTLTDWEIPFSEGGQVASYEDCVLRHGPKTRWLAVLDIDEFLFPPTDDSLPAVLREFEAYPGVVVNWQNFGSSGHHHAPSPLVTESYTRRAPRSWIRNRRVKSIVDPSRVVASAGPHFFIYRDGALAVTENFEPVRVLRVGRLRRHVRRLVAKLGARVPVDPYPSNESSVRRISTSRLRINHYVVKSAAAYAMKQRRYTVAETGEPSAGVYKEKHFIYHDRNEIEDTDIQRFLPALKAALAKSDPEATVAAT